MAYIDGFVLPVPTANKEAYRRMAASAASVFRRHGALRVMECWGDDLLEGKVTDFKMAVKAENGENVVLSWVVWPSKEARDAGSAKVMEDLEREFADHEMLFDGKRMFWGGFEVLVDDGDGRS